MLTCDDGVCNIDIAKLIDFHKAHDKIATMASINAEQHFGVTEIDSYNKINAFKEKQKDDENSINEGLMVLNPKIFDIDGDNTVFDKKLL